MTCSKCKITSYCSKACQVNSWRDHKKDCNKNNSFLSDVISMNQSILKNMGDFNIRISKIFTLLKAGKYNKILTMESEILECARQAESNSHDPNHLVMLYAALGDAYRFTGDRVCGVEYMKKSKMAGLRTDMLEPIEETNKLLAILNLGETYRDMDKTEEAMQEYRICYDLIGSKTVFKDEILLSMAKCHVHEARYSEAIDTFNSSMSVSEACGHVFTKCQCLIGMSQVHLLMGKYETAVLDYTTAIELMNNLNESPRNELILSVRQEITKGMAVASWSIAMDHKANTELVRGSMRKSRGFIANTELWTDVMKRSEGLFKQSIIEKTQSPISIHNSDVQLWLAYLTCSLGRNEEALDYLRKFLDIHIDKLLSDQCHFCGQINTAKCMLKKCSSCRVSKFCNVACQRAASTKRHMGTGRIVVTHKAICPLLTQWKKVKRGQISKGSCIQAQLHFLKECMPFKEMVLRHTTYNQAELQIVE